MALLHDSLGHVETGRPVPARRIAPALALAMAASVPVAMQRHSLPDWPHSWPFEVVVAIGLVALVVALEGVIELAVDRYSVEGRRDGLAPRAFLAGAALVGGGAAALVGTPLPAAVDVAAVAISLVVLVSVSVWQVRGDQRWVVVPTVAALLWVTAAVVWRDTPSVQHVVAGATLGVVGLLMVIVPKWWSRAAPWASMVAAAVASGLLLVAADDGELRPNDGAALWAVTIAAVLVSGLLSYQLLDWRWFWTLAWTSVCVVTLLGPFEGSGRHLALAALVVVLLLRTARTFSKTTLRGATAVAAVLLVVCLIGIGHDRAPSGDVRDMAAEGANAVVGEGLEPLTRSDDGAELGLWGWVAVAALLAIGYRHLEAINNRRYGGPIVTPGEQAPDGPNELEKEFLERVRSMQLPLPSPIPGGVLAAGLQRILKDSGPNPSGPVVHALHAAWTLAFPAPGVTADLREVTVDPPDHRAVGGSPDGPGGRIRITVTLTTTGHGRFVASHTTSLRPCSERSVAIEEAASFAAIVALDDTQLCPRWQRWRRSADAVEGLCNYRRVEDRTGRYPRLTVKDEVICLEKALKSSPITGTLRIALADRYDVAGRHLEALEQNLRASKEFDRLLVARYRLAASLSMASDLERGGWWTDPDKPVPATRAEVIRLLDDTRTCRRVMRSPAWRARAAQEAGGPCTLAGVLSPAADADEAAKRAASTGLLLIAEHELRTLRWQLSIPYLLAYSLRPSDRSEWLGFLRNSRSRRQHRDRVETLDAIVKLRLALNDGLGTDKVKRATSLLRRVESLAERGRPGSYYNAACLHALVAQALCCGKLPTTDWSRDEEVRKAVSLLERARSDPAAPLPAPTWMSKDPDLTAIRDDEVPTNLTRAFSDLVGGP